MPNRDRLQLYTHAVTFFSIPCGYLFPVNDARIVILRGNRDFGAGEGHEFGKPLAPLDQHEAVGGPRSSRPRDATRVRCRAGRGSTW